MGPSQVPRGDTTKLTPNPTLEARAESAESGRRAGCHPPLWLDPGPIHAWLEREVEWPAGASLRNVELRRLWVGRHGRLTFEWTLELSYAGRRVPCTLQGGVGPEGRPRRPRRKARVRDGALFGLSLWNESLGVWCCAPDRDRQLPALKELLDDRRLARLLAETAAGPLLGLDTLPDGCVSESDTLPDGYCGREIFLF